jgi:hypothetical protein
MTLRAAALPFLFSGLAALGLALVPTAARADCLVTGQTPMVIATLYFGETIGDHGRVTEAQWADFTAKVITPTFPDGFTVADGSGQWMDEKNHETDYDPTKILTVAAPKSTALAGKLLHVMKAYEKEFQQEAVGVTTVDACAGFDQ